MNEKIKEYVAIVWKKNSNEPGLHETLYARNSVEAHAMLAAKYGNETVISLTDVEAAAQPR